MQANRSVIKRVFLSLDRNITCLLHLRYSESLDNRGIEYPEIALEALRRSVSRHSSKSSKSKAFSSLSRHFLGLLNLLSHIISSGYCAAINLVSYPNDIDLVCCEPAGKRLEPEARRRDAGIASRCVSTPDM